MTNNEATGTIDQQSNNAVVYSDVFSPIRDSFDILSAGESIPYKAHQITIVQTIEDEMHRFATSPDSEDSRSRYEATLKAMRCLPATKKFVRELDDTLYREALKALADPNTSEPVKSAIVKASINLGIGGEKSPEIVSVYEKLQRLQQDYSKTRDTQERAAMKRYLLHVTSDPAKVDAFFAKASIKPDARFLSPKRVVTAASLVGAISLSLAASPAAAQDRDVTPTGPEQQQSTTRIAATTGFEKGTVPTITVMVDGSPLDVPTGVTIKAQAIANQAPTIPTVEVSVSSSNTTVVQKDTQPIAAQTTQKPAETPLVAVSPATGDPTNDKQPDSPKITAQTQPTTPATPETVAVTPSTTETTAPSNVENAPTIKAQAPDTSVTPKDGETPAAAIARVVQGHDASKAVYIIRDRYGSAGNHQAAPNLLLASTIDVYVSDIQAKILATNHADVKYTDSAITALAYLDAVANDPTILDPNRTVAKDAQTAIAMFTTTGEPYHDKLLAQEVDAAKQNLSSDTAGKFIGISEADQNTLAQLAGYASLAAKSDTEQNTEIQKIKDDEVAAAKAAADAAAAKAAADKAAADEAARKTAEAAKSTPEGQALQEMIDNAGSASDKRTYQAFQYFINNGFTSAQAAGIVGNLLLESASTMDPSIKQGGGGPGRGIAQWGSWSTDAQGNKIVAGRFTLLSDFAQSQGKNWDDLGVQLDFIMHEFQTTQGKALSEVKAAQNIQDAAYSFMRWYEVPKDHSPAAGNVRMSRGLPVLDAFATNVDRVNQERAAAQKAIDDAAAQKAADEAAQALKSGDIRSTLADGQQISASLKAEYGDVSGKLKDSELVSQPGLNKDGDPYTVRLNPEAMKGYIALAAAFKEHFGYDIRLSDSYRDYAGQENERKSNPNLAAKPGKSNHGWGLALDLASNISDANSEQSAWMRENGYKYGWVHPTWAHDGNPSNGAEEPWHWEFLGNQATLEVSQ